MESQLTNKIMDEIESMNLKQLTRYISLREMHRIVRNRVSVSALDGELRIIKAIKEEIPD